MENSDSYESEFMYLMEILNSRIIKADELESTMSVVFGNMEMDEDEVADLTLRTGFCIYERIDKQHIIEEIQAAGVKSKWIRRTKGYKEEEIEVINMAEE